LLKQLPQPTNEESGGRRFYTDCWSYLQLVQDHFVAEKQTEQLVTAQDQLLMVVRNWNRSNLIQARSDAFLVARMAYLCRDWIQIEKQLFVAAREKHKPELEQVWLENIAILNTCLQQYPAADLLRGIGIERLNQMFDFTQQKDIIDWTLDFMYAGRKIINPVFYFLNCREIFVTILHKISHDKQHSQIKFLRFFNVYTSYPETPEVAVLTLYNILDHLIEEKVAFASAAAIHYLKTKDKLKKVCPQDHMAKVQQSLQIIEQQLPENILGLM
jgi:hypothetical protein